MANCKVFYMVYDYSKLLVAITDKFGNITNLAKEMKCNPRTISDKIANLRDFDLGEVEKMLQLLEIPREKVLDYFFIIAG